MTQDDAGDVGPPLPPSHKRGLEGADTAEDVGPPRPPAQEGLVSDDEDGDHAGQADEPAPGPALPPAKRKRVLEHEGVYLAALPNAEMYEKSFMHRDTITHVVCPHAAGGARRRSGCVLTAACAFPLIPTLPPPTPLARCPPPAPSSSLPPAWTAT